MIKIILFSNHPFDLSNAHKLFVFLQSSHFAPQYFDNKEPIRKTFEIDELSVPLKLLVREDYGEIFLRSTKPRSLFWLAWGRGEITQWYIEIEKRFATQNFKLVTDFLAGFCQDFPIIYGAAAPDTDWDIRHWIHQKSETSESVRKVGLDLEKCLPSASWITIFGSELTNFFGSEKIRQTAQAQCFELGTQGMLVQNYLDPYAITQSQRLEQDEVFMTRLGRNFFFDKSKPDRTCPAIQSVIPRFETPV